MAGYFRAVAVDYDGTLTCRRRPDDDVLRAVAAARTTGIKVVLVTGRILAELRGDFPDVMDHFNLVVAENGAVLANGAIERPLAGMVDPALGEALSRWGIPVRRGQVLLACDASHDMVVLEEIHRLGFDYQLVYNRSSLMVLPPGVSKGSGVYEALGQLGISYHNAVGIGDAENDHALLSQCELGVAMEALRAKADVVLPEPNGVGLAAFLDGPIMAGDPADAHRTLATRPRGVRRRDSGLAPRLPAQPLGGRWESQRQVLRGRTRGRAAR